MQTMNRKQATLSGHKTKAASGLYVVSAGQRRDCSLAVRECQGSILLTLVCALHSLAAQHHRPEFQQTHIPAPGIRLVKLQKLSVRHCQLQPCKSQSKKSLEQPEDT